MYRPIFTEKQKKAFKRKERMKDVAITACVSAVIVFFGSLKLGG